MKILACPSKNVSRSNFKRRSVCLAAALVGILRVLALPGAARAATYSYTITNVAGDTWSSSSHWSAVPVSNASTVLVFGPVGAFTNTAALTNTNINGTALFDLNVLTLRGTGSATTGAPVSTTISGGTLRFSNPAAQINLDASNGTSTVSYALNSAISLLNNLTLVGNGTAAFSLGGVVSGASSLTKSGTSAVTLSGANTYTGGTIFTAGTLNLKSTSALGATASAFAINGGTIDNTSGSALTLANNNPITLGGDFSFTGSGALNLGIGAISATAARTITTTAGTLTLGGAITGIGGGIIKAGAGTLVLSGDDSASC